jgi:hypothetical protein
MEIRSEHLNKALDGAENKTSRSKIPKSKVSRAQDLPVHFDAERGVYSYGGRLTTKCEVLEWDSELDSEAIDTTKRI